MSSDGSTVTLWLVVTVVLGLGAALVLMGDPVEPPLSRGSAAPAFDLPRLDGEGAIALADLGGEVALVNFWATWCKPCEEEMPAMERLYNELSSDGFQLVAIAVDEEADDVRRFQERLQVSFPILLDPEQSISRAYQTTGFPETLLVSADGEIVERYIGPREWDHPDYVARVRREMERGPAAGR
jgi:peroxiredoxin